MPVQISAKNCILTQNGAWRKLRRMAFQIAENNWDQSSLAIAGIAGNGMVVAEQLMAELVQIISIPVYTFNISLNKKAPMEVALEGEGKDNLNEQTIILVDDVANTGKTMLYALKPFLSVHPKKIQTLVLVERSHKLFPIQVDYVGLTVSTTLQEHITVDTANGAVTGAWLH